MMGNCNVEAGPDGMGQGGGELGMVAYISGSFFMSAMAARGMPKLEAGPQKSVVMDQHASCLLISCLLRLRSLLGN